MSEYEYDYGEVEKKKDFLNEEQKTFWEIFSQGIDDGKGGKLLKGSPMLMEAYMSYERERENSNIRER